MSTKGNLSRHLKQVHSLADDEATRLCETVNPEIEKPPLLTVSADGKTKVDASSGYWIVFFLLLILVAKSSLGGKDIKALLVS